MQSRTGVAGLSIGARMRQAVRAHSLILKYAAYIAMGFLSANAFVLSGLAPFGVAFAASARKKFCAAATLGASVGYLLSYDTTLNMKYIISMILLYLLRWIFDTGNHARGETPPRLVLIAVSLGAPSLALTVLTGGSVYDAALAVAEVLLACCATYFLTRTVQAFELGLENLQQNDITSIVITFCIIILSLINFNIAGLSVGRMLAVLTILVAAQTGREAGGAIAGVAAGVSAGLFSGGYTFLMGTYAFGGLLAGVFSQLGRFAGAAVFITVNMFALLASRQTSGYGFLIEIFVAGLIAILLPQSAMKKLTVRAAAHGEVGGETYKAMLSGKIGYISGALRDVADTTRRLNDRLSGMVSGDISSVYHCAADKVCRSCSGKSVCWQERYDDTADILGKAVSVLRLGGKLTEKDFPTRFTRSCRDIPGLSHELENMFSEYVARENVRRKVAQVRGVVTDQFEGMALMIDAMGRDLDDLATQDDAVAGKVSGYMQSLTIFPDMVTCTLDGSANMTLEMAIPTYKLSRLELPELTVALSEISGRDFALPARRAPADATTTVLTFTEKAAYAVRWGASQWGHGGSRLCGDSYSYVDGRGGRINVILSDGMGSGGAAAVDSTMTSELIKRLIEAGVSLDATLKLVNSALLIKTGDESLATIDITGVDLYTGKTEFYKAGAAPTFIRKSGKGGYIESSSLPIGILGGVSFEKSAVTLRDGDLIVMVSDGALESGYEWIMSDLEHYEGDDPKELSERLLSEAKRRRNDGHEDDITVIVMLLERDL